MLGSLGWRVFFAAMLLMGVFAVLRAEGDTVSASTPDVVAMQGVTPSASVAGNVHIDSLAFYAEANADISATVGQATVGKARSPCDITGAADFHSLHTDRLSLAPTYERAFHMLKFQGPGVRAHMLS